MRSIFLGKENQIRRVYSPRIIQQLVNEAGLDEQIVFTPETLAQNSQSAREADYIFSTWGMPAMTAEEIEKYFPGLKAVFYAAGSVQGFARPFLERGIQVLSAWMANGIPVAEFAAAQILLANKGFFRAFQVHNRAERNKAGAIRDEYPGNYLCKVGIIGAGAIGRQVIHLLKSCDIEILVFDPFLPDSTATELGVEKCSLERLFTECQTITNHLANNPQTVGMLNYDLFSRMKPNAAFINTGRGAQVVEQDLVRILTEQPGIVALLDVTDPEPPVEGHPFYSLPNVFLTPHMAGSFGDEVIRMAQFMLEEFRRLQSGSPLRYNVTLEMLATMA